MKILKFHEKLSRKISKLRHGSNHSKKSQKKPNFYAKNLLKKLKNFSCSCTICRTTRDARNGWTTGCSSWAKLVGLEFSRKIFAKFFASSGKPMTRIPVMAKSVLDLYELYRWEIFFWKK